MTVNTKDYDLGRGLELRVVNKEVQDCSAQAMVCPINQDLIVEPGSVLHSLYERSSPELFLQQFGELAKKTGISLSEGSVVPLFDESYAKFIFYAVTAGTLKESTRRGWMTNGSIVYVATLRSMRIFDSMVLDSIAFPLLGAGYGGLPTKQSVNQVVVGIKSYKDSSVSSDRRINLAVPSLPLFEEAKAYLDSLNLCD